MASRTPWPSSRCRSRSARSPPSRGPGSSGSRPWPSGSLESSFSRGPCSFRIRKTPEAEPGFARNALSLLKRRLRLSISINPGFRKARTTASKGDTMRKSRIAVALALACMTAGALNADSLADAKKLVADGQLQIVTDFNNLHKLVLDPGKLACYKTYNDAVTAAQTAFKHCVNSPSANSPLGKFNALTNAQLATF